MQPDALALQLEGVTVDDAAGMCRGRDEKGLPLPAPWLSAGDAVSGWRWHVGSRSRVLGAL